MLRKSTLVAAAAIAAIGLAILSPGSANAKGGHGHGMRGGHGHGHGAHRGHRHHGHHHHRHRHRHWYVRYHRPIWYAPVTYARLAVAGPCTCLSKEYTQEGAVLFKDRCTNEMAMNPPADAPQPTAEMQQQPPPQTAYTPSYPPRTTGAPR